MTLDVQLELFLKFFVEEVTMWFIYFGSNTWDNMGKPWFGRLVSRIGIGQYVFGIGIGNIVPLPAISAHHIGNIVVVSVISAVIRAI